MLNNFLNSKEAKISITSLFIIVLILGTFFVAAQNSTNENLNEILEDSNLCENVDCEDSSLECPDDFVSSCSNSCDSETGDCTTCKPNCIEHEVILPEESSNETIIPEDTNKTGNNETIGDETENEIVVQENETSEIPITGDVMSEIPAELNLELFHQDKITRGEIFEIKVIISNNGGVAKNVSVDWIIPKGFEVVSDETNECGDLIKGESCTLNFLLETSLETQRGFNKINVEVNYE